MLKKWQFFIKKWCSLFKTEFIINPIDFSIIYTPKYVNKDFDIIKTEDKV